VGEVVVGVDEAGRGPLAGPVVCACVSWKEGVDRPPIRLNDSKSLSFAQRKRAFKFIVENLYWSVSIIDVYAIDRLNIRRATLSGMSEALTILLDKYPQLRQRKLLVLVDGKDSFDLPVSINGRCRPVIKGDKYVLEISCASILAKVIRDYIMFGLDCLYPEYGFADHKGYATAQHLKAIDQFGPCRVHRRSYRPVVQMRLW